MRFIAKNIIPLFDTLCAYLDAGFDPLNMKGMTGDAVSG
jgi:hypothetical protein